jgi:protein xylosyltransferase
VFILRTLLDHGMMCHFLECDDHMWRLGERSIPIGIQYEGATDWLCLHYNIIEYIVTSNDRFVKQLTNLFRHIQVPTEVNYIYF